MSSPDLRLLQGGSEVPTAREIAAFTLESGEWRSSDGRDLITFLTDEIGPEATRRLLNHADHYIRAKRAGGSS